MIVSEKVAEGLIFKPFKPFSRGPGPDGEERRDGTEDMPGRKQRRPLPNPASPNPCPAEQC